MPPPKCQILAKKVLLTRMLQEHRIPKVWRQAKIIALEKPGKDPHLAANYRPISLLSVCYKLLECILLHRISPVVEEVLSVDQAGFRAGRSTCDQVTSLTTYIENGFEKGLKTGKPCCGEWTEVDKELWMGQQGPHPPRLPLNVRHLYGCGKPVAIHPGHGAQMTCQVL